MPNMKMRFIVITCTLMLAAMVYGAEWNVADKGAVGDGLKDNTAVFQQTLDDAAKAGGGVVHVPAGKYRIDGNLKVPAGVALQGTFQTPPTDRPATGNELQGTVLLAYAGRGEQSAPPFIRMGNNAALRGVVVYYPEWKKSDVPPVPYPPCVLGEGVEDFTVENVCLVNPYEGIKCVKAARYVLRNVFGYPIWRGLYIDECYDINRVENFHYWPFGVAYQPEDPYCKWINTNGVAFEFARTDWQYVLNTFCFGYGVGYKFSAAKAGGCNGNFLGIGADCCQRAVLIDEIQPYGILISNGEFVGRWGSKDAITFEITEKAVGKISLSNCAFWGPIHRCIVQRGAKAYLAVTACNFVNWTEAAVEINAGKGVVQGSSFMEKKKPAVFVGKDSASVILLGNQGNGGFLVTNHAGERTQVMANEPVDGAATGQGK
jgi:hypothetical protein